MPLIKIQSINASQTLFQGEFEHTKSCLETAIACGIDLAGADLRHANLVNAGLDDARLESADLSGANLSGANMSEARMRGARLVGAALPGTCLAFADLQKCDFTDALFGATDIAGATVNGAHFSTLSAFTLNFRDTYGMADCTFRHETSGASCGFSRPPVAINGLDVPVILMDRHCLIGSRILPGDYKSGPRWLSHWLGLSFQPLSTCSTFQI